MADVSIVIIVKLLLLLLLQLLRQQIEVLSSSNYYFFTVAVTVGGGGDDDVVGGEDNDNILYSEKLNPQGERTRHTEVDTGTLRGWPQAPTHKRRHPGSLSHRRRWSCPSGCRGSGHSPPCRNPLGRGGKHEQELV